jgi:hypothetical protein
MFYYFDYETTHHHIADNFRTPSPERHNAVYLARFLGVFTVTFGRNAGVLWNGGSGGGRAMVS